MGLVNMAVAQQPISQIINNEAPDNGLLVIIADQDYYESVAISLAAKPIYQPLNVLLVNGAAANRNQVIDSINYALNHQLDFKKEMAYLVVVGDSASFIDEYSVFETDFFAAQMNLCNCSSSQQATIEDTPDALLNANFYNELRAQQRYHIDILDLERELVADKIQPEISKGGLGIGLAPNIIWKSGTGPNIITQISLYRYVRIKKKWRIRGEVDLSLNRPNPQDEIRSMVQSQLDFNSLLNGDDQTLNIDITVQGHGYLHAGVHAEYEPFQSTKWRPYIGVGAGFTQYLSLEVALDTIFVIEGGNFSPGSGGFDFGGGGFNRYGLGAGDFVGGMVFPVSVGIRTKLSPRWEFDTRVTSYYYGGEDVSLTSLAIQANLAFRFWKKEEENLATMPYLRLR